MTDALRQHLGDPDPVIRTQAAKELGKLGPAAASAADSLEPLLADPDPMVRGMAAAALGKIGVVAEDGVQGLVRMLEDPVIPVRFWAADALGRLGVDRASVRSGLQSLAGNDHPLAKAAAAAARKALRRLDSPEGS